MPEPDPSITHAEPPTGSGLTPCCGRTPFELPHTDRLTNDPQTLTCPAAEAGPWTLDHAVHLFAQSQSRPGALDDQGQRWRDCVQTGKVMIVCRCGYTSGLIDHSDLLSTLSGIAADHESSPAGD